MEKYAKLFGIAILCFVISFGSFMFQMSSGIKESALPTIGFLLMIGFFIFGIWGVLAYTKRKKK
ncbi:hypothetical protein KO317_03650 [Candidatus Micrarchaeota archaeon]|jgi:hypothetical protein|nr:hypothetical protein [Candidatus Micrarchaeota archaeon]